MAVSSGGQTPHLAPLGARLRPARPDDAAALAALSIQVWLDTYATDGIRGAIGRYVLATYTIAHFQGLIAAPGEHLIVAERDQHLLGYTRIVRNTPCPANPEHTAELATLYIQERFTRQGLGQALLAAARRASPEARLWLTAAVSNTRALAFYRTQGFDLVGTTHFEFEGERHPNHILIDAAAKLPH